MLPSRRYSSLSGMDAGMVALPRQAVGGGPLTARRCYPDPDPPPVRLDPWSFGSFSAPCLCPDVLPLSSSDKFPARQTWMGLYLMVKVHGGL